MKQHVKEILKNHFSVIYKNHLDNIQYICIYKYFCNAHHRNYMNLNDKIKILTSIFNSFTFQSNAFHEKINKTEVLFWMYFVWDEYGRNLKIRTANEIKCRYRCTCLKNQSESLRKIMKYWFINCKANKFWIT